MAWKRRSSADARRGRHVVVSAAAGALRRAGRGVAGGVLSRDEDGLHAVHRCGTVLGLAALAVLPTSLPWDINLCRLGASQRKVSNMEAFTVSVSMPRQRIAFSYSSCFQNCLSHFLAVLDFMLEEWQMDACIDGSCRCAKWCRLRSCMASLIYTPAK
eukprot:6210406-Pleurochrysis_carterae.AAC.1